MAIGASQISAFVMQTPIGASAVGLVVMQITTTRLPVRTVEAPAGAVVSWEWTGGAQIPAVVFAERSFVSHPRITTLRADLDIP